MFYPHLITGISRGDRVLEVGRDEMIFDLKPFMIEGFVWREPLPVRQPADIGGLVAAGPILLPTPYYAPRSREARSATGAVRNIRNRL